MDASFFAQNEWQIALLETSGFERSEKRTLYFRHSLDEPVPTIDVPVGFFLRCGAGEEEAEELARLHRAAFGTEYMTVERRLSIMRAPGYERGLDLVAVAADGNLAAYCICGLEGETHGEIAGYTDPIGTHPRYQQRGLGKAIVTAGLWLLKGRGAASAGLGTSSDNIPMQRLARSLGFFCVAEKLWFSKEDF